MLTLLGGVLITSGRGEMISLTSFRQFALISWRFAPGSFGEVREFRGLSGTLAEATQR